MNSSTKTFCKTCHIADHIKQCYLAGHQIISNGKLIPKYESGATPSYNMDSEDFDGRSEE